MQIAHLTWWRPIATYISMTEHPEEDLEEEQYKFYNALGRAITNWASIEELLYETVYEILGCTRRRAAVVYYRTPTLDSRVTLTSDLLRTVFPESAPGGKDDPGWAEWKAIRKKLKDALPTRNHLAHHQVSPIIDLWESTDGKEHKTTLRTASYKSHAEQLRDGDPFNPIGLKEIERHITFVSNLAILLQAFRRRVLAKRLK
jgi:hypothetical protein